MEKAQTRRRVGGRKKIGHSTKGRHSERRGQVSGLPYNGRKRKNEHV